jgi:hypothetical protein
VLLPWNWAAEMERRKVAAITLDERQARGPVRSASARFASAAARAAERSRSCARRGAHARKATGDTCAEGSTNPRGSFTSERY